MSTAPQREPLAIAHVADRLATITLNRPARHNALTPELLLDLRAAIARGVDDGAAALVLQGAGRSFSTGGDVAQFSARTGEELREYAKWIVGELNETILDLLALPIPVVAAVHGPVTGGSLGLVLAADIVVASPHAWFQPFYTEVGFAPDGGWTALLPARVGRARALAWQLANTRIAAPAALATGGFTAIPERPQARSRELAADLVARPAGSLARTRARRAVDLARVRADLGRERQEFIAQIMTEEARSGMAAFLGRIPREEGRR